MRATTNTLLACAFILSVLGQAPFSHARDRMHAQSDARPLRCRTQIKYRIGTVDSKFGISREEFQHAIEEAGSAWTRKREFFKYDRKGQLQINLVYDTRQEITQQAIAIRAGISAKIKEADLIEDSISPLRKNFGALEASYSDHVTSYERDWDSYNKRAKNWNTAGGVSETEFQTLLKERQSLQKQLASLKQEKLELNRSTDELNQLIEKHNALLARASAEASTLNNSGASVQFERGRHIKEGREEWIDIFQFEDKANLLVTLAHELGHALGIGHNANPASIMSPLIHTDHLALTAEDEAGLKDACSLN